MKATFHPQGYIEHLYSGGTDMILPWGIEFADSVGFFSLDAPGWRTKRTVLLLEQSGVQQHAILNVELPEGRMKVEYIDTVHGDSVHRSATLTAQDDLFLLDFVTRYRFRKEYFHTGRIAGQQLTHGRTNVYHQFPVQDARLDGDRANVHVQVVSSNGAKKMHQYLYIRDYKDEWVVHARLLPEVIAKSVVKLNTHWYNRALPQTWSDITLARPRLKKMLWYRAERSPYPRSNVLCKYILKPCAYPLIQLRAGEQLQLVSRAIITTP